MARTFILAVVLLSVVSSSAAVGTPAPAGATVPVSTACPNSPANTPTNSCFNNGGTTHVCCISPDSCGEKDASGGATCQNGNYYIFSPPPPITFTLINGAAACPSCNGAPSNACFNAGGNQKVCCRNPSACSSTTPTCSGNDYVTFTGTAANPVPFNC